MIAGTKRLVDCARRRDVGQVIIDTCGLSALMEGKP